MKINLLVRKIKKSAPQYPTTRTVAVPDTGHTSRAWSAELQKKNTDRYQWFHAVGVKMNLWIYYNYYYRCIFFYFFLRLITRARPAARCCSCVHKRKQINNCAAIIAGRYCSPDGTRRYTRAQITVFRSCSAAGFTCRNGKPGVACNNNPRRPDRYYYYYYYYCCCCCYTSKWKCPPNPIIAQ